MCSEHPFEIFHYSATKKIKKPHGGHGQHAEQAGVTKMEAVHMWRDFASSYYYCMGRLAQGQASAIHVG